VCGKSACTVRRGEGPKPIGPSYPYHDTNIHEFLLKFGFRRQYCRLNIVYSPMLSCVVSLAYPLRALALRLPEHPLSRKLKALLVLESYRRSSLPTAPGGTSRSLE